MEPQSTRELVDSLHTVQQLYTREKDVDTNRDPILFSFSLGLRRGTLQSSTYETVLKFTTEV